MKDLTLKLLAIFQIECKDHLARIRSILDTVKQGEAELSGSTLDEAFRRAHSLKGAARAVGMGAVERLSHRLENLFAAVREGRVTPGPALPALIHRALDSLEDAAAAGAAAPDAVEAMAALEAAIAGKTEPPPAVPAGKIEMQPADEPRPAPAAAEAPDMLRIATGHLDRILRLAGELAIEAMRQSASAEKMAELVRAAGQAERERSGLQQQAGSQIRRMASAGHYPAVAAYVNYLEHQTSSLSRECRVLAGAQRRGAWTLRQLTRDLQDAAQHARMIPADSLYEGFGTMVRDLARTEGKEVLYEARGLQTLADRSVLEGLKDSVMHMLRNAVAHGVATPDKRLEQGKPAAGTVRLAIEAAASRLLVSIEDDGDGLDHERIARHAVERGLIAPEEAASREPAWLVRMIFQPGFSTAAQVTGLSGRGMGLSVVQEAVERLQGQVEVRRNASGGTTFTISTPLAVSSLHLLLIACAGQVFAIPAHAVERIYRADVRRNFEMVEGRRLFAADGTRAPVAMLRSLLGFEPASETRTHVPVLLVRANGRRAAMVVDEVLSGRQSMVQDFGAAVFGKMAAGAILLEDGSVAVVLNLAGILGQDHADYASWSEPLPDAQAPGAVPAILVVDDSMTTRALEKSILEAHGYRVAIAMDGLEGLTVLQKEKIDLVITDIEMPRMDGFTLIEEMKKSRETARIPVIIVSSVEKREEQARGLALGADAYIVKRSFEQQELLETIRQIL